MKNLLFSIIALLLMSCYNQERNCKDFRTGKFRSTFVINGKKTIVDFERKDSLEIETFRGKTDTAIVRWVNDCEYVITKKTPKTVQEKKSVVMRIISTTQNSYRFEYNLVGSENKQKGEAFKIDL